jgi:ankyrin repeat protein
VQLAKLRAEELMDAAFYGSIEVVKEFLASPQVDMFIDYPTGEAQMTALIAAAEAGRADVVTALLDAHADTNVADGRGRTALMAAAGAGETDVVSLLLKRGANPALKACNGWSCLQFACSSNKDYGHCEMVQELIDARKACGVMAAFSHLELQSALGIAQSKKFDALCQLLEGMLEV